MPNIQHPTVKILQTFKVLAFKQKQICLKEMNNKMAWKNVKKLQCKGRKILYLMSNPQEYLLLLIAQFYS